MRLRVWLLFWWLALQTLIGLIRNTGGGVGNFANGSVAPGVDPTGKTDSTTGLINAIQQAFEEGKKGITFDGIFKVGENKKGLDLRLVAFQLASGEKPKNIFFEIYFTAGSQIVGNAALPAHEAVVTIAPPESTERQFQECRFTFGQVIAPNRTVADGVHMFDTVDSTIRFSLIEGGFVGFFINVEGLISVCGNNYIYIDRMLKPHFGIAMAGNKEPSGGQPQGNTFFVGHIGENNQYAVAIDSLNGKYEEVNEEKNCFFNKFYIGAIDNPEAVGGGILDCSCRGNQYHVGATSGNSFSFQIAGGTTYPPYVRGAFLEANGVKLNGKIADLVNTQVKKGYLAAQPAVPASNEEFENTVAAPLEIFIKGGTVTAINKGVAGALKATGMTSGLVRLMPGERLSITWAVKPEWTVFVA